jgi:hypothetical protein
VAEHAVGGHEQMSTTLSRCAHDASDYDDLWSELC